MKQQKIEAKGKKINDINNVKNIYKMEKNNLKTRKNELGYQLYESEKKQVNRLL